MPKTRGKMHMYAGADWEWKSHLPYVMGLGAPYRKFQSQLQ